MKPNPYYKPLKMLVTITIPIETEVRNVKKELPVIAEAIANQIGEEMRPFAGNFHYYTSKETNEAVGEGEDACTVDEVYCGVDWKKVKTKIDLVKKKRLTSK